MVAFQTNPTSKRFVLTVVVGSATVDASNDAPQVVMDIALVPVIEIHNFCPFVGVPVKLVVNDEMVTL